MGEEPDDHPDAVPRRARRPRTADPGRADAPRLRRYERASARRLDFEDMLGLALRLFDEHPGAAEQVRARFAAFTVDEYQDVNPLQAGLLERWLGDRDELCVVGDDYQTIYAFTGASPEHLLGFTPVPEREGRSSRGELPLHPRGARARQPARDTPGRVPQVAPGDRPSGPPRCARRARRGDRGRRRRPGRAAPARRKPCRSRRSRCSTGSTPAPSRSRRRSPPRRSVPGARRRVLASGPRAVLQRLKRSNPASVAEAVEAITDQLGYDPEASPDADEEVTRQSDLGRMRSRDGVRARRWGRRGGVRRRARPPLLHRAQRPRREPAHLPSEGAGVRRGVPAAAARRRAPVPLGPGQGRPRGGAAPVRRDHARPPLPVPHLAGGRSRAAEPVPGRDGARAVGALEAEGGSRSGGHGRPRRRAVRPAEGMAPEARERRPGVPAYVVFHDRTLAEIAERRCKDWADLAAISGVGPAKLERYADEVLAVVAAG